MWAEHFDVEAHQKPSMMGLFIRECSRISCFGWENKNDYDI